MHACTSHLVLLFAIWAMALVTMNGATQQVPEELATLLPAISNDSQTALEIRAHFKRWEFAEVARLSNGLIQRHPQS